MHFAVARRYAEGGRPAPRPSRDRRRRCAGRHPNLLGDPPVGDAPQRSASRAGLCRCPGPAAVRVRALFHLRRHHQLERCGDPQAQGIVHAHDYGELMLVQSAFFAAYFMCRRAGGRPRATRRLHARRRSSVLCLMAAGCLLFVPASAAWAARACFSPALFVLAAGITVIQVVANPLISPLGPPPDGP